uniref:Fe2OG dioxygenase domain-containing protein n=1 Tax=Branchiostoma floridae TaxID=7739 RepID=C3ZRD3_BRAFL|eukprot:XP_002588861.1 hypothetical protein BRAFLDRAFT_89425 [Branchiostoma floridae]
MAIEKTFPIPLDKQAVLFTVPKVSAMEGHIPVVDFSPYGLSKDEVDEADLQPLADKLVHTFATVGFVYLVNTGIQKSESEEVFGVADRFFDLSLNVKEKYARPQDKTRNRHGWVCVARERSNLETLGNLKEAFDINMPLSEGQTWPTEVPEFEDKIVTFYEKCRRLDMRILELIGRGLHIPDVVSFLSMFQYMGRGANSTTLSALRYPPVPDDVNEKQMRCREHTDWGAITLLFQDGVPGLEVMNKEGDYKPAPYVPGSVLVNIGDMLQRWSGDKLVSTKHRVVMPESEKDRKSFRRSIAFFTHPDEDTKLVCLDGSNKYDPITAKQHVQQKLKWSYLDN